MERIKSVSMGNAENYEEVPLQVVIWYLIWVYHALKKNGSEVRCPLSLMFYTLRKCLFNSTIWRIKIFCFDEWKLLAVLCILWIFHAKAGRVAQSGVLLFITHSLCGREKAFWSIWRSGGEGAAKCSETQKTTQEQRKSTNLSIGALWWR